jgi:ABC-type Fe3+-hydroxamate transport system substrate-binding protein
MHPPFGSLTDDLGHPVGLERPPQRIVSLVPSLTEALAVTVPDRLVGATDWCTHPAGLEVPRVRGTKNPDRSAIAGLAPDLVVANQEENRRLDVERLRVAGIPVWVTVIESLDQALRSMRRLFADVLAVGEPDWLTVAAERWTEPPPEPALRVVVPIWRDPWMVIGSRTFTGDLLARLGLTNAFRTAAERYPRVGLDELRSAGADLVLLPDEPYVFSADDGPEAFPDTRSVLVSGRALTWYGPSLATARTVLLSQIHPSHGIPRATTVHGDSSGS